MSFSVRLAQDTVVVDPGINVGLDIEVANRADGTDQYELSVEGLDPEWTAVPVPTFSVSGHDIQIQKIFFKPPRTSESLAGHYPFVVKLRSLETGEVRATQGVLAIQPYHHVSMEILPKKGAYSPLRKSNVFHINLVNLGNSEHTMQLFGSDPEDSLVYSMPTETVSVGAGQQKEVDVTVTPAQRGLLSSPRLHGFQVSARSLDTPSVYGTASAQLEQRPLVSAGGLFVAIFLLLLVFVWVAFMPKPPAMDSLTVVPSTAYPGETVTVQWSSSNAKSVKILYNGNVIVSAGAPRGTVPVDVAKSGTFEAVAVRDNRTSAPMQAPITVKEREVAPLPEVVSFDIKTREVEPGESFLITYKLKNCLKATLTPVGALLDPKLDSIQVEAPNQAGWLKYQIIAENASGQTATSRTISVNVVVKPKARIVVFQADPVEIDPLIGKTTIKWQITNAVRAELIVGGEKLDLPKTEGEMTLDVTKTVQITLVGYDENDVATKKSATLKVKPPEPPVDDSSTGSPPSSSSGGNR